MRKIKDDGYSRRLKDARKDPEFLKEVKRFVKASKRVYKLD